MLTLFRLHDTLGQFEFIFEDDLFYTKDSAEETCRRRNHDFSTFYNQPHINRWIVVECQLVDNEANR